MKELLTLVSLVISCVAEPPAPYPASGWRPNGPSFELPQRTPAAQNPQTNYLQPLDPRNKPPIKQQAYLPPQPDQEYGVPEPRDVDLSVQGLPQQEQVPIFQLSPLIGQQYVGPDFDKDIRSLDQSFRESQVQNQQEIYRQLQRQRELEASQSNNNPNGLPAFQPPRQFGRTTPKPQFTTYKPEERTTEVSSTTELSLNEGETLDNNAPRKDKVTVEIAKQNIQEFPAELYLNPIAQLRLQPQLVPIQFGQIKAYPEQSLKQYDAQSHFAALTSVLAQQQLAQQVAQIQPQYVPPQNVYSVPQQSQDPYLTQQPNQYAQTYPQFQVQPALAQNPSGQQPNQYAQMYPQVQPVLTQSPSDQNDDKELPQPQLVYQYQLEQQYPKYQQPQFQQPQYQQPQYQQPQYQQPQYQQSQYQQPQYQQPQYQQPQYQQPQYQQPQYQQPQYQQPQYQYQEPQQIMLPNQYYQPQILVQENSRSGIDDNKDGNDIDQPEEANDDDGATATAVATAFGARTQPRVNTRYGTPEPVPRVQANPGYQTTPEPQDEPVTDDGSTAEALTAAGGNKKKSAKLRNRRVRPVFTLDKSGHLVLAQEQ